MNAIYYREHYYLIPQEYDRSDVFLNDIVTMSSPCEFELIELLEDHNIRERLQKGVSITPYFICGYSDEPQKVMIESPSEVYPAEVEILTQDEYNIRLREVVTEYCPGCMRYKPLTKNVCSLNGHFEEITLDKVCFFRQETKPSPRCFHEMLMFLGGFWNHFPPENRSEEMICEDIKSRFYMKWDNAEFSESDGNMLLVSHKTDFFLSVLTAVLSEYIESWLYFTKFRIKDSDARIITEDDILSVISEQNAESFRKSCKKYGVSIGILEYPEEVSKEIERSLSDPIKHNMFYPLYRTAGKTYYLLTDTSNCLKMLHFRYPMLEKHGVKITVYSQSDVKKYEISRYMKRVNCC